MTEAELLGAMIAAFVRPLIEEYQDIYFKAEPAAEGAFLEARFWNGKVLRICSLTCGCEDLATIVRELCELEDPGPMEALKVVLKKGKFSE